MGNTKLKQSYAPVIMGMSYDLSCPSPDQLMEPSPLKVKYNGLLHNVVVRINELMYDKFLCTYGKHYINTKRTILNWLTKNPTQAGQSLGLTSQKVFL